MMTSAPRIGFDRFIALEWATTALKVRADAAQSEDLHGLLDAAGLRIAAHKKTRTVLNRLWLEPRTELAAYANRGVAIFQAHPDIPPAALHWGMALATYPFFGKVAELIGRLTTLQGDCTSAEIHRRMRETYGEREGTTRMTNMVIQSQAGWGAVERIDKGKRLVRCAPTQIQDHALTAWLIEAVLRYAEKPLSIANLASQPSLFPFCLPQSLDWLIANSTHLAARTEGPDNRVVALREPV